MYFPKGRQAQSFGVIGETVPEGFVGQMLYPFGSKRLSVQSTTAVVIETA
jgi:hypothetical protein